MLELRNASVVHPRFIQRVPARPRLRIASGMQLSDTHVLGIMAPNHNLVFAAPP